MARRLQIDRIEKLKFSEPTKLVAIVALERRSIRVSPELTVLNVQIRQFAADHCSHVS